jgi:hypothetical protein
LDCDHALVGGQKCAVKIAGRIRVQGRQNGANSARGGVIDSPDNGVNTTIAVRADGRWLLAASRNTTHRRLAEKVLGTFVSRTLPSPIVGQ